MTTEQQPEALRLADFFDSRGMRFLSKSEQEVAAELRRLHRVELAYRTWVTKTDWLHGTFTNDEIGMHLADVLKQRIERLHLVNGGLLEALEKIRDLWEYEASCGDLANRLYDARSISIAAITKAQETMTNCPHCRNIGYDASGYPCTCGLEVPEPDQWQEYVLGLFAVVVLIISVILLTIKLISK